MLNWSNWPRLIFARLIVWQTPVTKVPFLLPLKHCTPNYTLHVNLATPTQPAIYFPPVGVLVHLASCSWRFARLEGEFKMFCEYLLIVSHAFLMSFTWRVALALCWFLIKMHIGRGSQYLRHYQQLSTSSKPLALWKLMADSNSRHLRPLNLLSSGSWRHSTRWRNKNKTHYDKLQGEMKGWGTAKRSP